MQEPPGIALHPTVLAPHGMEPGEAAVTLLGECMNWAFAVQRESNQNRTRMGAKNTNGS